MMMRGLGIIYLVTSTLAGELVLFVGGPAPAYAPGPATYVGGPPPAYAPGPTVAAAPYGGPGYGYGPGPDPNAVIVNPVTGRWCRTEANGYQFCYTP